MKFLILKELNRDSVDQDTWLAYHQRAYKKDPIRFAKEYEKLVKSISDLQLLEYTLRTQVLHQDDFTDSLRSALEKLIPLAYRPVYEFLSQLAVNAMKPKGFNS
jgi:hypothetical protein